MTYKETAFKIGIKRSLRRVKCISYHNFEVDIRFLKAELRHRKCPSIIHSREGDILLCIPETCFDVLKELAQTVGSSDMSDHEVDEGMLGKLIHDSIRIELLNSGNFKILGSKIVNIGTLRNVIPRFFVRYDAYKTRLLKYKNSFYLGIDRSFKLEPTQEATLDSNPYLWLAVTSVKVRAGSNWRAFILTHNICDSSKLQQTKRLVEFLGLNPRNINWDGARLLEAQLHPLSYTLGYQLKRERLLSKDGTICLPDSILYPVASLENIKYIAEMLRPSWPGIKLTLAPKDRFREAEKFIKTLAGRDIDLHGLQFEISEEPLSVDDSLVKTTPRIWVRSANSDKQISETPSDRFDPKGKYAPLHGPSLSEIKIAVLGSGSLREKFGNSFWSFKNRLVSHLKAETKARILIEDIDYGNLEDEKTLRSVLSELAKKEFKVVIAPVTSDKEYALFETNAVRYKLIPQSLNLSKNLDRGDLSYRALPIARHIEYVLGYRLVRLQYPRALGNYSIVAVDATPVWFRGYAKLGVAPVLMDPSGLNLDYLDLVIGENEEEVIEGVFEKLSYMNIKNALIYVNRRSIPPLLLEKYYDEFEQLIIIAISKIGVPRLVIVDDTSVRSPERGIFVEHTSSTTKGFNHYEYLGVTSIITDIAQKQDLTPITGTYSIYIKDNVKIDVKELLDYVYSSTMIFVESPLYLPSFPQPLHEAHRKSRKLHKLSRYVDVINIMNADTLKLL